MRHPYQCLALARSGAVEQDDVLLAACGSEIYARQIQSGELLAVWPERVKEDDEDEDSSAEIITTSKNGEEPARKRRRKNKPKGKGATGPAFTKFLSTRDGRHLIATTGEDKSVFVFEIGVSGEIKLLSRRQMTKRPCAITLTPENDLILVGDKFGDVYALPLHQTTSENGAKLMPKPAAPKEPYKPVATELTVHTARNRKALESQRKAHPQPQKEKETMDFEHELLLGHVSMLTDVATATVQVTRANDQGVDSTSNRSYILTADRDEHIRVSRGRPQSWIIENYCFGHTQFVSKLCLPTPDILVSGGGDDHLFIWHWRLGTLLGKVDLQTAISKYWDKQPVRLRRSKKDIVQYANDEALTLQDSIEAAHGEGPGDPPEELEAEDSLQDKVAVSGIWTKARSVTDKSGMVEFFCASEAIPAIFKYSIPGTGEPFDEGEVQLQIFELAGNPLDVAVLDDYFLVSIDNVHDAASKETPTRITKDVSRIQSFALDDEGEKMNSPASILEPLVNAMNENTQGLDLSDDAASLKSLQDLLYGTENLRKRGNEDS